MKEGRGKGLFAGAFDLLMKEGVFFLFLNARALIVRVTKKRGGIKENSREGIWGFRAH
jgi:hypothetical protein